MAAQFQHENWQNWTQKCPELENHQKLWLDPWRTKTDEAFRLERDNEDWQTRVVTDFAVWLNVRLHKQVKELGKVEQHEWETQERFRTNLREMEKILQGALK